MVPVKTPCTIIYQRPLRVVVPTDVMFDTQLNTLVMSPTPSCTPALPNEMAL
jgi:hypothetical protein